MKNLIDSKINFSVVTEDSLIQAYTLDASQAAPEQVLMSKPGNLYVLQEPQHASLSDELVAERSGEDLLLVFRSQEQARPALKFEQFFSHDARLHVLKHDGELLRAVMGQDDPQQGPVAFDLQAASATEQQVVSPVLGLLLPSAEIAPAAELEPQTGDAAAPVQLAALNVAPLSAEPPQITHAIDQIGARQGSLASGSVTDDSRPTFSCHAEAGTVVTIYDNGYKLGDVRADANGNWSFPPENALANAGHSFTVRAQDAAGHLISAVHAVYAGATYISPQFRSNGQEQNGILASRTANSSLTRREAEVIRLYVSGLSVNGIANQLKRTKQTVSSQKSSAMRKLGISRDVELFRFAYETGLEIAGKPMDFELSSHRQQTAPESLPAEVQTPRMGARQNDRKLSVYVPYEIIQKEWRFFMEGRNRNES